MNLRRHGVWLMVALTFVWAALPAAACLLPVSAAHRHACCEGMMESCSPSMDAQAPCCQFDRPAPATAPVGMSAPVQAKAILVAHSSPLALVSVFDEPLRSRFDTPTPDPSPGGISVLRI